MITKKGRYIMNGNIKEYLENLCVGISFLIVSVVAMFYIKDDSFVVNWVIRYGVCFSMMFIALSTKKFIKNKE
jgi:hypothetical protein